MNAECGKRKTLSPFRIHHSAFWKRARRKGILRVADGHQDNNPFGASPVRLGRSEWNATSPNGYAAERARPRLADHHAGTARALVLPPSFGGDEGLASPLSDRDEQESTTVLRDQRPRNDKRRGIGTLPRLKTAVSARLHSRPRNEGQEYLELWTLKLNRARWARAQKQAREQIKAIDQAISKLKFPEEEALPEEPNGPRVNPTIDFRNCAARRASS